MCCFVRHPQQSSKLLPRPHLKSLGETLSRSARVQDVHCLFPLDRVNKLFREEIFKLSKTGVSSCGDIGVDRDDGQFHLNIIQGFLKGLPSCFHEWSVEGTTYWQQLGSLNPKIFATLLDKLQGLSDHELTMIRKVHVTVL